MADLYKEWDETVCRAIGRLLHGEYRGHDWQVWVSRQAGIAKIWLNCLMNPAFPYVLHLTELLRRVHANLSERVPPLAADFHDLDDQNDGSAVLAPSTAAELSPVGGRQ